MSQRGVEELIGKALADPDFLEGFLRDPEGTVKRARLDISSKELEIVRAIDAEKARRFAIAFSEEFVDRRQGLFG